MRSWPSVAEPSFLGFAAFKAGMTHVTMIDDSDSPAKGSEVSRAATLLEIPELHVYGIRLYTKKYEYKEPATDYIDQNLAKKLHIKNIKNSIEKLPDPSTFTDATALVFIDPANLGIANNRIKRMEIAVGGKSAKEKAEFIKGWIGKSVKVTDVLGAGDYIDVKSISTGKGWAGVVKRFGVATQGRKATGKRRHLGVMGAWHPAKVLYTVPHSGHMGYNYRTELNKRILKIGSVNDAKEVNVKGGFLNYGVIKNDYIMIDGSIPGPSKRFVRIRKALRSTHAKKEPKITYISLASKQGS
jgi:large subunit ribosomal protein L3